MNRKDKKAILKSREILQNPYAYDNGLGGYDAYIVNAAQCKKTLMVKKNSEKYAVWSDGEIKTKAREMLVLLWRQKDKLWKEGAPIDPVDLIDPEKALGLLGYDVILVDYLGEYYSGSDKFEVAGEIDKKAKKVRICRNLPRQTHMFTMAHELGHAILHEGLSLHRDKPVDGFSGIGRNKKEKEADRFAVNFLMPEKLVQERFEQAFGTDNFELTDETGFALQMAGYKDLLDRDVSLRQLARILAKTGSYAGNFFNSLASQFGVSVEAMAIRLEELRLVRDPRK